MIWNEKFLQIGMFVGIGDKSPAWIVMVTTQATYIPFMLAFMYTTLKTKRASYWGHVNTTILDHKNYITQN